MRSALSLIGSWAGFLFGALAVLLASAQQASAAATLTITPLTWNIIGLDSNNPLVQGPYEFLSGARVCNTGTNTANDITATYVWDSSNSYINISPRGTSTLTRDFILPGECEDLYFLVRVTRTPLAYNTTRRFHIEASASNAAMVSTPTPRELYVERLISQNRNDVLTVTGPSSVYVGQVVNYTVHSTTATQGYEQLSSFLDFPNLLFQIESVHATYSAPTGATNDSVYADACGWDPVIGPTPPTGTYRSCKGPANYTGGKAGGDVTTTYSVKFLSAGSSSIVETIYDFSGSSYHYNADVGLNTVNIASQPPASYIQLTKSCSPSPGVPGGTVTCTITYGNSSPSITLTGVEINETYDPRTTYASATPAPDNAPTNSHWTIGTLSPGQYGTITVTLNVSGSAVDGDTLLNRVTINDDVSAANDAPGDPPGVFAAAETTIPVAVASPGTALLRVTKTGTPDPAVGAGSNITYTIAYQNAGAATSYSTVLTDTLGSGLTFVSSTPAASTSAAPVYTWNLGNLAPGASGTITVVAQTSASLTSGTVVVNDVVLQGATGPGTSSSEGLTATAEEQQFIRGGSTAQADLSITKTDATDPVTQSGLERYTVTVTNAGPDVATNVVVTDTLDSNTTFSATTGSCTNSSGTLTCSVGTLAVGASASFTVDVVVSATAPTAGTVSTGSCPASGVDICNRASVTATSTDPITSNNSTSTATNVTAVSGTCDLTVSKTEVTAEPITPGTNMTYAITVQNLGPNNASDVIIRDELPVGMTYVSDTFPSACNLIPPRTLECHYSSLTVGAGARTRNITVAVASTVATAGSKSTGTCDGTEDLCNRIVSTTVSGCADTNLANNTTSQSTDAARPSSDLSITKSDTGYDPMVQGGTITYSITVSNAAGSATANSVQVVDTLGTSLSYLSTTASGGCVESPTRTLTCSVGSLAAGASTTFSISTLVSASAPTASTTTAGGTGSCPASGFDVCNSATVSSFSTDPNSANNTVYQPTNITSASANLSITKTDTGSDPLLEGGILTYQLSVTNSGPNTANNVVVTDVLDTNEFYLADTAPSGCVQSPLGTLTCALGSMANGTTTNFTITVFVPTGGPTSGTLSNGACNGTEDTCNTASVSSSTPDPTPGNNTDDEPTDITAAQADVLVTKIDTGSDPVTNAGTVTYSIHVENLGPNDAQSVVVTDVLDTDTTYVSDTFGCVQSPVGTLTCGIGALFAGQSYDFTVTAQVSPSAPTAGTRQDGACNGSEDICNNVSVSSSTADPVAGNNTSDEPTNVLPVGACATNADCSDGLFCTGVETCVANACVAGTNPCTGGDVCGNVCNEAADNCFVTAGTVCRASAGACDVAETCTGSLSSCPADSLVAAGTTCRASTGVCDVAEACTGSSSACPADTFASAATTCRASAGSCDVAETCTGSAAACPADSVSTAGTMCRAAAGVCDVAETCDGSTGTCPADGFSSAATVCRTSAGVCDVAENCTGSAAACPADAFSSAATICRTAAGVCDVAENCTGSAAACPADTFSSAATVCRAAAGVCDVAENCTGSAAACPADSVTTAGTVCRAPAGVCDVAETCDGSTGTCPADGFASAATVCRTSAGVCDVAESCSGSAAACPTDSFSAATSVCRTSAGVCDVAENCTGSAADCPVDTFSSAATPCRTSTGVCDTPENCTGSAVDCPADSVATAGTVCRTSAGVCDVAETCDGSTGTCPADGFTSATTVCRTAAGVCDTAENCTGSAADCPGDSFASAATTCRASAGSCDVAENCPGSAADCPADTFSSAATVCRAAAGVCDVAENCTGSAAACPADGFVPATSPCGNPGDTTCDNPDTCDGSGACVPNHEPVTTSCRAVAGICDVEEFCNGAGACADDVFAPTTTTCRAAAGDCDVAETCTGTSAGCPANGFAAATTPCGSPVGTICDNPDSCDGAGTCLTNPEPVTTSCRAIADACDAEEFCDGAGTCPVDAANPGCAADLSVTKSDAGLSVGRGDSVTYTIVVANDGPADATGVTAIDTLDASTTYVSDTGGCTQAPAGTLTCPVGALSAGSSTSFTVTVLVGLGAPFGGSLENGPCDGTEDLCNQVAVSAAENDLDLSNNSDSEPTDVTTVDLAVVKSDTSTGANRLQDLAYTIVVTNNGPGTATNVIAIDTLDPDTTYVSDTIGCTALSSGILSCPVGTLGAGASATFSVTVNVNADAPTAGARETGNCNAGSDLCNRVSVSAPQADSDPSNNSDEEPTNVTANSAAVDLAITKSDLTGQVEVGSFSTYEITVTNAGPDEARDAIVVDTLDTNMDFVSSTQNCTEEPTGTLSCPLGDLASGASSTFRIVVHVDPATPTGGTFSGTTCPGNQDLCNRATVGSLGIESNPANNSAEVSTDAIAATMVSALSLTKTDLGAEPVQPGSTLTYEIVVANAGPNDAADVVVHETLDPFMAYVSDDAGCVPVGSAGGRTRLDCPLGSIASGSSATMQMVVTIAADAPVNSTMQDGDCTDAEDVCNEAVLSTSSSDFSILDNSDSEPTDVSASLTCNDGLVDPGETCDPVSPEICNNGIDDDDNGLVDCADSACTVPAYQSCDGNCQLTPVCLPILDDPAFVRWNRLNFHGRFIPQTPADPFVDGFRYVLANANGVVYSGELLPGDMRARTTKGLSKWVWKDTAARKSRGLRDGIFRVGVHQRLEKTGEVSYVMTILAFGDMSLATLPTMTTHIYIGDDVAFLTATWRGKPGGWRLSRKDAILAGQP